MPNSIWTKRTRIDPNVTYDSSFAYDSAIPYDSSYYGSQWTERTPINIPLRQENNDYILDDNEYPIMVEFTDWSKRTRIDTLV